MQASNALKQTAIVCIRKVKLCQSRLTSLQTDRQANHIICLSLSVEAYRNKNFYNLFKNPSVWTRAFLLQKLRSAKSLTPKLMTLTLELC